jgi:IS6 family transposase
VVVKRRRRSAPPVQQLSAFVGFRFPPEVIMLAVRWYLRFGLSYRDLEELLAERGVEVDHVTLFRWVQRFTPLLVEAAKSRPRLGQRHVDDLLPRWLPVDLAAIRVRSLAGSGLV